MRPHQKLYSPEEINLAHIILDLSDHRQPRSTTGIIKRIIMSIVHSTTDQCLTNKKLVFATATKIPTTDWATPEKIRHFHTLCDFFSTKKVIKEPIHTINHLPAIEISSTGMFCRQRSTINKLIGQDKLPTKRKKRQRGSISHNRATLHDQSSCQPFSFASPPPGRTTYTFVPQKHDTLTAQPYRHLLHAIPLPFPLHLVNAPTSPYSSPRKHLTNNTEASFTGMRSGASPQLTPRRSYIKNSRGKNKDKNITPNRQRDDATLTGLWSPCSLTTPSPPQVSMATVNITE